MHLRGPANMLCVLALFYSVTIVRSQALPAPGTYSPLTNSSTATLPCPIGMFCTGGLSQPLPCTCPSACPTLNTTADPLGLHWTISTFVGSGVSSVVDGTGLAASFAAPFVPVIDSLTSTIYLSDNAPAHVIRAISPVGVVTTLSGRPTVSGYADGVGTTAMFFNPSSMTFLPQTRGILVCDTGNYRVRAVAVDSRTVTTFAFSGAASNLDGPYATATITSVSGIAYDLATGVVYVYGAGAVRRLAGGVVSTLPGHVAGTLAFADGPAPLFRAWGIAMAWGGATVYVFDQNNAVLRVVNTTSGVATTLSGYQGSVGYSDGAAFAARFTRPTAGVLLPSGTLAFTEFTGGNRVRLVSTTTGYATTVGGSPLGTIGQPFSSPVGIASTGDGTLYIADSQRFRVAKAVCSPCPLGSTCPGGGQAVPCPPGTYGATLGLTSLTCTAPCSSPPGFACTGGSTNATGSPCPVGFWCGGGAAPPLPCTCPTACPTPGTPSDPIQGLAWTSSTLAGSGTDSYVEGTGVLASFRNPWALTVDPNSGTVFVADNTNFVVRRITPGGTTSLLAGIPAAVGSIDGPQATATFSASLGSLAYDPTLSRVYVADTSRLRMITPLTGAVAVATLAGSGTNGNVDGQGGAASFLSQISGIACCSPSGTLYVTSFGYNSIRAVTPTGVVTTVAGNGLIKSTYADGSGTAALSINTWGLTMSPSLDTTLFMPDQYNTLRMILPESNTVVTFAGSATAGSADGYGTAATFSGNTGIASSPSGAVVVGEFNTAHRLRLVSRNTGQVLTVAGPPYSLAGYQEGQGSDILVNNIVGVAMDANGTIYFSDSGNRRVRKVTCSACARGSYCVKGKPFPCMAGFFGAGIGATTPTCSGPCSAAPGFGCGLGSTSPAGTPCPPGFFCPGGATPPQPCSCPGLCLGGAAATSDIAPQWQVTAVAGGSQQAGYVDGVPGLAARFSGLRSPTLNPTTTKLYIGDDNNHRVRVVDLTSPTFPVALVAGSGVAGFGNGVGAAALFNRPLGLCMHPSGSSLYVMDLSNHRVRSIALPGEVVTTLLGSGAPSSLDGIGPAATFIQPNGCSVDPTGSILYIVELGAHRVRQAVLSTLAVTTLAGSTAGSLDGVGTLSLFNGPTSIATTYHPLTGALTGYVGDRLAHRLRSIAFPPDSPFGAFVVGTTATLVGNGVAGVSDGTGTTATLSFPDGVGIWNRSLLFSASTGTSSGIVGVHRSIRVTNLLTGVTTTIAGAVSFGGQGGNADGFGIDARFACPTSMAVFPNGSVLMVTDTADQTLKRLSCSACPRGSFCPQGGGSARPCPGGVWGGTTGLFTPTCSGPCTASPGFACQSGSTSPTGSLCPPYFFCPGGATPPQPCSCPYACATSSGLAADPTTPCPPVQCNVTLFAGTGAAGPTVDGPALTTASFRLPRAVAVAPSGDVWVAEDNYATDGGTNADIRVVSGGVVSTLAGSTTAGFADGVGAVARLSRALHLAFDPGTGTAYVADLGNNRVRAVTPGGVVTTLAGSAGVTDGVGTSAAFSQPHYVLFSAGVVYVSDYANCRIRRISVVGANVTNLAGGRACAAGVDGPFLSTVFSGPKGLGLSPDGLTLYVADATNSRCIRALALGPRMSSTLTGLCGVAGFRDGLGSNALWTAPESIAVDSSGMLWITDMLTPSPTPSSYLRMVSPGGVVQTVATYRSPGVLFSMAVFAWVGGTGGSLGGGGVVRGVVGEQNPSNQLFTLQCSVVCRGALGYFCGQGMSPLLPCPPGTFGNTTTMTSPTCASPCTSPPGFHCPAASTNSTGVPCPVSFYCPGGAALPLPCPQCGPFGGNTCPTPGMASPLIPQCAPSCSATTVAGAAGVGGGGFSTGLLGRLKSPRIPVAVSGGVYVCEDNSATPVQYASSTAVNTGNGAVRFIALPSGVVSNIAGSGVGGFMDGVGVTAQFNRPLGIACLPSGTTCWVADYMNMRVRSVTSAGVVTSFVGTGVASSVDGVGTAAAINGPHALAVDPSGAYLLVSEAAASRVRRVVLATGVTTTLVGAAGLAGYVDGPAATTARISGPKGLAFSPDGMVVYVSDTNNKRIRAIGPLIPPGSEVVTSFAGNGGGVTFTDGPALSLGIAPPESLFVDPIRGGVWVVGMNGGGEVRYITSNSTPVGGFGMVGGWGTVIAGGVSALSVDGLIPTFGSPTGISLVSSSPTTTTFVVADNTGNSLRSLTCTLCPLGYWCGAEGRGTQPCPPGVYAASPGLATSNCSGPCTCPPGYACMGGSIGATPTAGCTLCPVGAVCPGGSSPPIPCTCPTSACATPGLSSEPPAGSCQWGVTTGAGLGLTGARNSPIGTLATFSSPKGISFGVWGGVPGVLVADTSSNLIRWVNISSSNTASSGNSSRLSVSVSTLSGSGVGASVDGSTAASFLSPQGVIPWRAPLATSPSLLPTGLAALVVESQAVGTLRGLYLNGSVVTLLGGGGGGLSAPRGLEQDPLTGTIYIANHNAHTIVGVNPASFLPFVLAGLPGTSGYVDSPLSGFATRLNNPSSLALSPATPTSPFALYVTEAGGHRIRVVGASGATSTLAGSGVLGGADGIGTSASFVQPTGIVFDTTGLLLYVAEGGGHRVRRVVVRTRAVTTLAGGGVDGFADSSPQLFPMGAFSGPRTLTLLPSTGQLWVADSDNNRLRVLTESLQPLGYYNFTLPCQPGFYGGSLGLTTPSCSGPCTASPGYGCGAASPSPSGTLCPIGYVCPGGASPPLPCACPDTCPTPGLSSPPPGAGTGSPAWQVSTLTTLPTTPGLPARGLTYYPGIGDSQGGVLFIADDGIPRVWQYSMATSAVVAFSGLGVAGYADGAAIVARFSRLFHIAALPSTGTLYVADFGNNRVRTVSVPSGAVSTLVGNGGAVDLDGVGTLSQFNGPVSLSLDPSGAYLFVVTSLGCSVRRVALATRAVRNLAGVWGVCGAAMDGLGVASQFNALVGVYAGAGGGVVYLAERVNARVRVLYNATAPDSTANTTTVSTVIGWPGVAGFADGPAPSTATVTHPQGLVVADGGGTLLFTDASGPLGAGKVRSVTLSGGPSLTPTVTTIAGPLDAPTYVIDKDGFGSTSYLSQPMALALVNGTLFTLTVPGGLKKLNCSVCPVGSFCINGAPRPCPWGTYGATTGLSSASACTPCTSAPGFACAPGSVAAGGSYQCVPGTWCPGGSSPPMPCTSPAACPTPGLALDPLAAPLAPAVPSINTPLAWSYTLLSGNGAPTSIDGSSAGGGASHRSPTGLALGTSGLYVADFLGNEVRLVSLGGGSGSGGTITYVGSGVAGAVDGVGTAATLHGPQGLCVDPASQTLYIGEYYGNRVRAVAAFPSATITTLAGSGVAGSADGVGTDARFNNPTILALDATTQVLYVVEETGCVVRAIDLETKVVSRLAGSGACGVRVDGSFLGSTFSSGGPAGMALDVLGRRLYLALWGGNGVLALDLAGGSTSLVLGSPTGVAGSVDGVGTSSCTLNGPRGLALEAGSSALLVAEWGGNTLRRIPLYGSGNSTSTPLPSRTLGIPGCTGGVARNPYALIPSFTLGTYFYSDFYHNRVMMASLGSPCFTGQYCTLVGNASTSSTLLPTLCPAGRFGGTTDLTSPACSGPCNSPPGFGCPAGSTNSTGVPCPPGFACAGGASHPLRCALAGVCGGGMITDPFPGSPGVNSSSSSFSSSTPTPNTPGVQWVVTTLAGGGGVNLNGLGSAAQLSAPSGMALAPDGMGLYVSEYSPHRVRRVELLQQGGGSSSILGGTPQAAYLSTFLGPTLSAVGYTDGMGEGARLRSPFGLTPLNSTTTLLVDAANHALRSITLPCTLTTLVGTGVASRANGVGTSGGLNSPSTVVVDSLTPGAAYVMEEAGCAIRYVNLTTLATSYFVGSGVCSNPTFDGTGTGATIFNPTAGVQDTSPSTSGSPSTGRLLVADWNGNKIRAVTLPGGVVSTFLGSGVAASIDGVGVEVAFNGPRGVALDGVGCLFIGEAGGFRVRRAVLATLQVTTLVGLGVSSTSDGVGTVSGGFGNPLTMVVLSPGLLLTTDYSNARLRLITATICPPGYYCAPGSTSPTPLPCPPGYFSAPPGGATQPSCAGQCSASPGFGCGWASTSPGGTLCPVGSWCGGGGLPPTPCTCPSSCPNPGATADPYATVVWTSSTVAGGGTAGSANGVGTSATFTSVRGVRVNPTLASSASLAATLPGAPPSPTITSVCVTDGTRVRLLTLNATALALGDAWATVSLLAGSTAGTADGVGALATLGTSMGCTWTAAGGLVVADQGGFRLRSITVPGGAVTTLAALGTTGGLPIGGSRPRFGSLAGIATLSTGDFVVVDESNNALRGVSPTGYVTLLAGSNAGVAGYADGVGTSVRFSRPWGIACDSAVPTTLACYVGDWDNARVRILSPFDGTVRTLSGSGAVGAVDGIYNAVQFAGPVDMTVTPSGLLVIGMWDAGGDSIRLIDPTTGAVTTIAGGSGARGMGDSQGRNIVLSAPIGINALGGAFNGTILFSSGNTRLRALTCSACQPGYYCIGGAPFACPAGTFNGGINGGSLAAACLPCASSRGFACLPASTNSSGVACPIGYFCPGGATPPTPCSCAGACSVRGSRFDYGGGGVTLSTVAGTGVAGGGDGVPLSATFSSPRVLIVNGSAGVVFTMDFNGKLVRVVSLRSGGGGSVTTLAGSYAVGGALDSPIGTSATFTGPIGGALGASGANLFVADFTSHKVRSIALPSGEVTTVAGTGVAGGGDGPTLSATLNTPTGLAFSAPLGILYISEPGNNRIRALSTLSSTVSTLAGNGTIGAADGVGAFATLNNPWGLALSLDAVTTLYFAERAGNKIRSVTLAPPGGGMPLVLTLAGFSGVAGALDGMAATATFNFPSSIAVGPLTGLLYITDFTGNRVRRMDPFTGNVTTFAGSGVAGNLDGTPATTGRLSLPAGIAVDTGVGDGESVIYVSDSGTNYLRAITCYPPTVTPLPTLSPSTSPSTSITVSGAASPSATVVGSATPGMDGTPTPLPTPSPPAAATQSSGPTSPPPSPTTTTSTSLSSLPTPTAIPTQSSTPSCTPSTTSSATLTPTASPTTTPTLTATPTGTMSPGASGSVTPSAPPTTTPSPSPTPSPTPTPSFTPSPPAVALSSSSSPSMTLTPSATPTASPPSSPSQTASSGSSGSGTPSPTPSMSLSSTPSPSTSPSPSNSPTLTPSPSPTLEAIGGGGGSPTSTTPSPTPSQSGTFSPTGSLTTSASTTLSPTPTGSLSTGASPSATGSDSGTGTPTPSSSGTGSGTGSITPSTTVSQSTTISTTPTGSLTQGASPSNTASNSNTASGTPSTSPTPTPTGSGTQSGSDTPSFTPSTTVSASSTISSSMTPSLTQGVSPSNTASNSLSSSGTPALTPTSTSTGSPTTSGTSTPTFTPSSTVSGSSTVTSSPTASLSQGASPSATPSVTPSPSVSGSGSISTTPTPTPTATPTSSPTATTTSTTSGSSTVSSSQTPSLTKGASPSNTPSSSQSPSLSATQSPTSTSTVTPTSSGTGTASGTVSVSPTSSLSQGTSPSVTPTSTSTPSLSTTSSLSATGSITPSPSATPTSSLSPGASGSTTSTQSASGTPTQTPSGSLTVGASASTTSTSSFSASSTSTPTPSLSPGLSPSSTSTSTLSGSPTSSPTPSLTKGASGSTSSTNSLTASPTATPTPSVSLGLSASTSSTSTLTASPSPTPSSSITLGASPSTTSSATLSGSPTSTPTSSLTAGGSPSSTSTSSLTSSPTTTPTPSLSVGLSPSSTTTSTLSGSPTTTPTPSLSVGLSPSSSSTSSLTGSPTATPTSSLSVGLSSSTTSSATLTGSPTITPTPSLSRGSSPSTTSSATLTASPTTTPTTSATLGSSGSTTSTTTLSASPTGTPSATLSMGASPSASSTTTLTASPTPTPSPTLSLGASPSASTTATLTGSPSRTPSPTLSTGASPSPTPSSSPTLSLGASPSPSPSSTLTPSFAAGGNLSSSSSSSSTPVSTTPSPTPTVGGLGGMVADGAASASSKASILSGSGLSMFFIGTGGMVGVALLGGGLWMMAQRRRRSATAPPLTSPSSMGGRQRKLGGGNKSSSSSSSSSSKAPPPPPGNPPQHAFLSFQAWSGSEERGGGEGRKRERSFSKTNPLWVSSRK